MTGEPLTEVRIGDTVLVHEQGQVLVYDERGEGTEEVGAITAQGLQDAARLDDEVLSYLGALAYGAEQADKEE